MSAPAFTPGPWEWHPCYDPTGKHLTSLDVCLPNTHSLSGVAVLASVWGNQEANARLIAAAPELYEALMLVAPNKWGVSVATRAKINAALAKARGQ